MRASAPIGRASADQKDLQAGAAMRHRVPVHNVKISFNPGMKLLHIADLGVIVQDHAGRLAGDVGVILLKPRVAVGAGDDRRLGNIQRTIGH